MPKIEDVKIETIGEDTKVKGVEKIETIYPETIELPNYQYGQSQNTLDYDLALRNKPSGGGQFKIGSFTITTTGNISITGVGFKPKLVKFIVGNHSGNAGGGIGSMTEANQQSLNIANSTTLTTQCIYTGNPVSARAVYVSMDNDGFTINCTYFANNTYVLYECYG